jgi:hypothetical protein
MSSFLKLETKPQSEEDESEAESDSEEDKNNPALKRVDEPIEKVDETATHKSGIVKVEHLKKAKKFNPESIQKKKITKRTAWDD